MGKKSFSSPHFYMKKRQEREESETKKAKNERIEKKRQEKQEKTKQEEEARKGKEEEEEKVIPADPTSRNWLKTALGSWRVSSASSMVLRRERNMPEKSRRSYAIL